MVLMLCVGECDGVDVVCDDIVCVLVCEREMVKLVLCEEGVNDGVGVMCEFNDDDEDVMMMVMVVMCDVIECEMMVLMMLVMLEMCLLGECLDVLDEEVELMVESFLRAKFDAATTTTMDFESVFGWLESDVGGRGECVDDVEMLYV